MRERTLEQIVRHLDGRAAARRLIAGLGFEQPLRAVPMPPRLRGVRQLSRTTRGTVAAYLVELRHTLEPDDVRAVARSLRTQDGTRPHVIVLAAAGWSRVSIAYDAPGVPVRSIQLERDDLRAADLDVLAELAPEPGEGESQAALRIMRALDRLRIGDRFFRDFVVIRDRVARCWTGVPLAARGERDALALLFLSRLMFLYFLQRRGLLAGDPQYLPHLLRDWLRRRRRRSGATFYRSRLQALFFGALNRKPAQRTAAARALGALPYLNGGLFDRHRLERSRPRLDLDDNAVAATFSDLLEKYRFTAADAAATGAVDAGGVDPEMLGRVFEGLMPAERRERTGTFYTPVDMVDRVVAQTLTHHLAANCQLDAALVRRCLAGDVSTADGEVLDRLRRELSQALILDPACGSGAFLLGALSRLSALLAGPGGGAGDGSGVRHDIVARSLHGVDLLEDAALICSLRLWLALAPHCEDVAQVPPLPNLDRRVRQGDALVDPLDIGDAMAGRAVDTTAPPELRGLTARLRPLAGRYLTAGPETKPALRGELDRLETAVARAWLRALDARLAWEERELRARARDRDLFGAAAPHAAIAEKRLVAVQRRRAELTSFRGDVGGSRQLPFFSFRVQFAEAEDGFDVILSNPPWVRAHRWPAAVRGLLRDRYRVCARAGWPAAARLVGNPSAAGAQVDLSLLFLERSTALLRRGGTLGMLMPAKLFRSLYAGGARELLQQTMRVASLEDHSLDHRTLFEADAFTSVVIARRPLDDAEPPAPVNVTLHRRGCDPLRFTVPTDELAISRGDERSPWLLVPPGCRRAIRRMQVSGEPIGERLTIRRGVMTGANEVLVAREVVPKLGDIARIRTEGYYRAVTASGRQAYSGWVEASALRPALRGTDIGAWRTRAERHVLWTPHNENAAATAPIRLGRFLRRHRSRLRQQDHEIGALHRLSQHTLGNKVVWSDVATDLRAAAVAPRIRCTTGLHVPLIPLNTVYFIATTSRRESLILAAYLNALPLRVFARAVAERAKDAHFRFFAWTIAVLPLPPDWRDDACAPRLLELSTNAHGKGAMTEEEMTELDDIVADAYGLGAWDRAGLREFDAWLTGRAGPRGTAP